MIVNYAKNFIYGGKRAVNGLVHLGAGEKLFLLSIDYMHIFEPSERLKAEEKAEIKSLIGFSVDRNVILTVYDMRNDRIYKINWKVAFRDILQNAWLIQNDKVAPANSEPNWTIGESPFVNFDIAYFFNEHKHSVSKNICLFKDSEGNFYLRHKNFYPDIYVNDPPIMIVLKEKRGNSVENMIQGLHVCKHEGFSIVHEKYFETFGLQSDRDEYKYGLGNGNSPLVVTKKYRDIDKYAVVDAFCDKAYFINEEELKSWLGRYSCWNVELEDDKLKYKGYVMPSKEYKQPAWVGVLRYKFFKHLKGSINKARMLNMPLNNVCDSIINQYEQQGYSRVLLFYLTLLYYISCDRAYSIKVFYGLYCDPIIDAVLLYGENVPEEFLDNDVYIKFSFTDVNAPLDNIYIGTLYIISEKDYRTFAAGLDKVPFIQRQENAKRAILFTNGIAWSGNSVFKDYRILGNKGQIIENQFPLHTTVQSISDGVDNIDNCGYYGCNLESRYLRIPDSVKTINMLGTAFTYWEYSQPELVYLGSELQSMAYDALNLTTSDTRWLPRFLCVRSTVYSGLGFLITDFRNACIAIANDAKYGNKQNKKETIMYVPEKSKFLQDLCELEHYVPTNFKLKFGDFTNELNNYIKATRDKTMDFVEYADIKNPRNLYKYPNRSLGQLVDHWGFNGNDPTPNRLFLSAFAEVITIKVCVIKA